MSIHDKIQGMLPGYVINALEADEAARAEVHLASCESCMGVLEQFQSVARALASTLPMARPPRDLKARTIQRALAKERSKIGAEPAHRAQPSRLRSWFASAFVGAALLIVLVALGVSVWQSAELNRQIQIQRDILTVVAYKRDTQQIVYGTEKAPDAVGRLYLDLDSTVAALVTVNMPPLREDRVYQVWLTTGDGRKVSGGVFLVDTEGNGFVLVHAPQRLDAYVQVAVTDEPAVGSISPTTGPVLLAKLTSQ